MSKAESNKEELIICCLCNEEITPDASGWQYGHNPAPLGETEDDRCCDSCNYQEVIPARLQGILEIQKKNTQDIDNSIRNK
jgi:hypothetical protein